MARLRRTPPGPSDVTHTHPEHRVTSLAPGMAAQTRGCNPHAYKSAATPALPCPPLPRPRGRQRGILQPGFFLCRLRCSSEHARGSAACFGSQRGTLGRWILPRTGARAVASRAWLHDGWQGKHTCQRTPHNLDKATRLALALLGWAPKPDPSLSTTPPRFHRQPPKTSEQGTSTTGRGRRSGSPILLLLPWGPLNLLLFLARPAAKHEDTCTPRPSSGLRQATGSSL